MKIFKIDTGLKFIVINVDDKTYIITFRIGLFKGIYDIEVSTSECKGSQCGSPGIIPGLSELLWFEITERVKKIHNKIFHNQSSYK